MKSGCVVCTEVSVSSQGYFGERAALYLSAASGAVKGKQENLWVFWKADFFKHSEIHWYSHESWHVSELYWGWWLCDPDGGSPELGVLTPPFTPTLPKDRNFNVYVACSFLCIQLWLSRASACICNSTVVRKIKEIKIHNWKIKSENEKLKVGVQLN